MRIEPVFTGKICVTTVKNGQDSCSDYETSPKDDVKILKLANNIFSYGYPALREPIEQEDGEKLLALVNKITGAIIDMPKNAIYTYNRASIYNPQNDETTENILLLGKEDTRDLSLGDRTGINILI